MRLKELREARGWTQADLATRASVSQSWVAHVEAGRRDPSMANAIKVADALRCSLDALCGRPFENDIEAEWRGKIAALLET